jgi:hypothetical protein
MGFSWAARRVLLIVVIVMGVATVAVHSTGIRDLYLNLYPIDPARRQALELCFAQDHEFKRLDAGERENCYRQVLVPLQARAGTTPVRANPVDLRHAAAAGSMSRNDVRRTEQMQDALHLPH